MKVCGVLLILWHFGGIIARPEIAPQKVTSTTIIMKSEKSYLYLGKEYYCWSNFQQHFNYMRVMLCHACLSQQQLSCVVEKISVSFNSQLAEDVR